MGSTLVTAVWGDAFGYVLMHYNGYSWDQVLGSHPAGAFGQRRDLPSDLAPANTEHSEASR